MGNANMAIIVSKPLSIGANELLSFEISCPKKASATANAVCCAMENWFYDLKEKQWVNAPLFQ